LALQLLLRKAVIFFFTKELIILDSTGAGNLIGEFLFIGSEENPTNI